jgi:hypothetical protein
LSERANTGPFVSRVAGAPSDACTKMCFIGFGSALMTNTKGCSRNDAAMHARCAFWFRFCLPLHQTSLVAPEPQRMERPGRATWPRVGITTWEECLAVERSGRLPRYKAGTSNIKSADGRIRRGESPPFSRRFLPWLAVSSRRSVCVGGSEKSQRRLLIGKSFG